MTLLKANRFVASSLYVIKTIMQLYNLLFHRAIQFGPYAKASSIHLFY